MAGSRYDSEQWRRASSPLKSSGLNSSRSYTKADGDQYLRQEQPYARVSFRSTNDLMSDLERQHEQNLTQVYDRVQVHDQSHEREIQRLKTEVSSLRQQVDQTSQSNSRELLNLRSQYQQKLVSETRNKDSTINSASGKLAEIQQIQAAESDRSSHLRQELLTLKVRNGEEVGRVQSQNRALAQELEYLKHQTVVKIQTDIDRLKSEKAKVEEDHDRAMLVRKQENQTEVNDLQNRLAAKEALVRNLEYEVSELRKQLLLKTEAGDRDVSALQDTLKSMRNVLGIQEQDLDRLKQARDEARKGVKTMSKEVAKLEEEFKRVKSENEILRSSSVKMERLVYGKGAKRPSSPRS